MAMTRIEDGIQDTEPIRFLELLGLDEEDLAGYSIRLNGSNPEWGKWSDLPDAYYFSYDDLMKWIFTKKWPDKDKQQRRFTHVKSSSSFSSSQRIPTPHNGCSSEPTTSSTSTRRTTARFYTVTMRSRNTPR